MTIQLERMTLLIMNLNIVSKKNKANILLNLLDNNNIKLI